MILALVVLASRNADAEILIRWDLASIPPPQALGISVIVVPAEQAQGIKQALAQGYRVYVEIDAAAAASFSPIEGTAGVIVNGLIASDVRERLAQRAKIVRSAENRGKWPHIRTNWVTLNKDVLQVTNRSSQPWLENNEALIRMATAASPPGAPPVLLTYAWQPVTVADLDQGPRRENYLVAIAEAGGFGADLLLPLHERFERELMAGSPDARADWEAIRRFVDFYAWNVPAQHRPVANVGVVTSDPMRSFEMLNLLARHNLPFVTIVPAAVTAQTLAGLDLVVLLDEPTGGGRAAAARFAKQGGAVVEAKGAPSDPNTCTRRVARVTAVYSSSRVSSGDSGGGSTNDTTSNWLPWARCTVMACVVWTASSRTGEMSSGELPRPKAARTPPPTATTTPVSPLNRLRS